MSRKAFHLWTTTKYFTMNFEKITMLSSQHWKDTIIPKETMKRLSGHFLFITDDVDRLLLVTFRKYRCGKFFSSLLVSYNVNCSPPFREGTIQCPRVVKGLVGIITKWM